MSGIHCLKKPRILLGLLLATCASMIWGIEVYAVDFSYNDQGGITLQNEGPWNSGQNGGSGVLLLKSGSYFENNIFHVAGECETRVVLKPNSSNKSKGTLDVLLNKDNPDKTCTSLLNKDGFRNGQVDIKNAVPEDDSGKQQGTPDGEGTGQIAQDWANGDVSYITEDSVERLTEKKIDEICNDYFLDNRANPKAEKDCKENAKKKRKELLASLEKNKSTTTCAVEGIGWIICPVVNFLSGITDMAYAAVASMLTVPSVNTNTSDTNNSLYQAWSIVRNLANVCFVIAFLVVIYSQLTSAGISNYGIKKMLPKLIVSAVLVNVSYWICALAVDISNFLGYAISGTFATIGRPIMGEEATNLNSAQSWSNIAAGVLAAAGALAFLQLAILLPLLVGAVLVIVTVVIILTLRQGLIVMLIVVSPLAFVAYLLPNTSKLFNRWWDAFKALLMMFPVVAFVYAGSAVAGKVLAGVAKDMDGSMKVGFQIMAAAIPILSFITVYALMKTSSALLGKMINNNPAKGIGDRMKRGAENRGKRYDNQRSSYALNKGGIRGALVGGRARARARSAAVDTAAEKNKQYAQQGYVAEEAQSEKMTLRSRALNKATFGKLGDTRGENFVGAMSRGGGSMARAQATAQAISTSKAQFNDAVKAEQSTMNSMNPDNLIAEMQNTSLTEARRTAAAGMVAASGSGRHIQEAIDYLGQQRSAERLDAGIAADDTATEGPASHAQSMQQQMASQLSKYKPAMMGASKLGSLERGDYASTYEADITDRVSNGKVSGEGYVSMSPDDRVKLQSVMENYQQGVASGNIQRNQAFEDGVRNLVSEVNKYASAPQNAGKVSKEIRGNLDQLAGQARVSASSNPNPSQNPGPNQPSQPTQTPSVQPSQPSTTQHQGQTFNQTKSGLYIPRD